MNSLLPPEPGNIEQLPCPECGAKVRVTVVRLIDSGELASELLDGKINRGVCRACRSSMIFEVPIFVNFPSPMIPPIQFIPYDSLEDSTVLDFLIELHPRIHLVYSMEELARSVHASLLIAEYREEQRVIHRRIVIPDQILQRIQGTYKKAKLKTIWFISTCFEEDRIYTPDEVLDVIWRSMNRMDETGGSCEATHLRAALCELGFLDRTPDGREYWKIEQPQNSER